MTKFSDLYKRKNVDSRFIFNVKNFDLALENIEISKDFDEIVFMFLLLDCNTKDGVINRVKNLIGQLTKNIKRHVYEELSKSISDIDIEIFLDVVPSQDYILADKLIEDYLGFDALACVDKYLLYQFIFDSGLELGVLEKYTSLIVKISEGVLSNPNSLKGEVRMAVSTLKKIGVELKSFEYAIGLVQDKYVDNPSWKLFYEEEVLYRQGVLNSSFGLKVSEAFRDKDYNRVVNLIGKYDGELPDALQKKLVFSRKKIQY